MVRQPVINGFGTTYESRLEAAFVLTGCLTQLLTELEVVAADVDDREFSRRVNSTREQLTRTANRVSHLRGRR